MVDVGGGSVVGVADFEAFKMKNLSIMLLAAALTGCGQSGKDLSGEYAQIKQGMTLEEVTAVLGEPTSQQMAIDMPGLASVSMYAWEWGGDSAINVSFSDGKVQNKSIVDP